jgi:hypothetical protein
MIMDGTGYTSENEKYANFDKENTESLRGEPEPFVVFTNKEEKDTQIAQISKNLRGRLNLSRNFKENPNIEIFYQECSSDVWEACELLQIPLPGIRLKKEREDGIAGDATSSHVIRISPNFVEDLLKSFKYFDKLDLQSFIFHESYHLWQYIHFPNSTQRETDSRRPEVGALLFEEKFLKNVSPKTPKEFVSKMLKIVETRGQLITEKTRKK